MKEKKETEKQPVETFVLRIDKNLKELATNEAKENDRSLNKHIITLIKDDLKKKDLL